MSTRCGRGDCRFEVGATKGTVGYKLVATEGPEDREQPLGRELIAANFIGTIYAKYPGVVAAKPTRVFWFWSYMGSTSVGRGRLIKV